VGQTYELRISADDVQHGFGGIPDLGLGGVTLNPGSSPAVRTFTPTSAQIGIHTFTCSITCGKGHPFDGTIEVVP
jgi:heme/copper-type cytochrome/quinol oxidase subunit 2